MDTAKHWIGLNMVLGVGKTLFHRLVHAFGSPQEVFATNRRNLLTVEGIGEKIASEIKNFEIDKHVEREYRLIDKYGLRVLTSECSEYPSLLKSIFDPPPVLYCKGQSLNNFSVPLSVVGTRQPSAYGKVVTEKLCSGLSEMGFCIVSGLARGIDSLAHKAALQAGSDTIAVFGCGLSHTYPSENISLRERIIQQGAIVSEFPVSMRPERNNFPARNRVISGLSYGTLVIEAGEKSGALITADFAVEQGREVFAVPGNLFSPKSKGCNGLIQNGAKLVDSPESILEEMPLAVKSMLQKSKAKTVVAKDLNPVEQKLISLLSTEEQHIDLLIENSQLSPAEVSATLVKLELRGLVMQLGGKIYISNCGNS